MLLDVSNTRSWFCRVKYWRIIQPRTSPDVGTQTVFFSFAIQQLLRGTLNPAYVFRQKIASWRIIMMLTVLASSSTLYLKMHVFSEDFSLSTPEHKNTVFAMEKFVHSVFSSFKSWADICVSVFISPSDEFFKMDKWFLQTVFYWVRILDIARYFLSSHLLKGTSVREKGDWRHLVYQSRTHQIRTRFHFPSPLQ